MLGTWWGQGGVHLGWQRPAMEPGGFALTELREHPLAFMEDCSILGSDTARSSVKWAHMPIKQKPFP